MTRTRLVLVRHGQTDGNASGRFQGQLDVPLNDVGRAQASEVAPWVADLRPQRIVSSDLTRALATAEPIADACGLSVEVDAGLREIDVGTWQWRTPDEIAHEAPWYLDDLHAGRDFRRSATGETATEAGERVRGVLERLAAERPGQTTVVVGHGLATRIGLTLTLGLGFEASFAFSGLWNCSWSVLELRDRWRLVSYNNVVPGHSGALKSPSSP